MEDAHKKQHVLVVAHTHWDREWYASFQAFRVRLVDMMDSLLEILRTDPEFQFTLDGQTVLLEDYLEIRPSRRKELQSYIRRNRVHVGPWYTQCDTRLIHGESIIRNLLEGKRIAEDFGGNTKIGYLPDNFGNIGQLPQLLRGFGIDSFISGRGIGCDANEFIWEGPDGSEVIGVFQRFGYPTFDLDRPLVSVQDTVERFRADLARLAPFEKSGMFLLAVGGDHCFPQSNFSKYVREASRQLGIPVSAGSYSDYIAHLKRLPESLFPKIRGELIVPLSRYLHASGTLAARMPLKCLNKHLENLLIHYAEPLLAASALFGNGTEDAAHIHSAWQSAMQNHAHDSIYGCCTDEAIHNIESRGRGALETTQIVIGRLLDRIAAKWKKHPDELCRLLLFHPVPRSGRETVSLSVELPDEVRAFRLCNSKGQIIDAHISKIPKRKAAGSSLLPSSTHYTVTFETDLPPCGFSLFHIIPGRNSSSLPVLSGTSDFSFENKLISARVEPDGTLSLYNRKTGDSFSGLNTFVDGGNTGDLFTYSPPQEDNPVLSTGAKISRRIRKRTPFSLEIEVKAGMRIPAVLNRQGNKRAKKTILLNLATIYTFYRNSARVDIRTEFENHADQHRLRVHFPLGRNCKHAMAQQQFWDELRKSGPEDVIDIWDKPQGLYPAHGAVQAGNLTVCGREFSQYEVSDSDNSEICFTLLLSTGVFRDGRNILTRKKSWSNPIPTPDAQCHGRHLYHYSIFPAASREALEELERFQVKPLIRECKTVNGTWTESCSLVGLSGNSSIRFSTLKPAEKGSMQILRLFNPTGEMQADTLLFNLKWMHFQMLNLDESPVSGRKSIPEKGLNIQMAPGQIITIGLIK